MGIEELRINLNKLIEEYIDDENIVSTLKATLIEPKAKYVLVEIERNKTKEYSPESKALIQEIAFYYC